MAIYLLNSETLLVSLLDLLKLCMQDVLRDLALQALPRVQADKWHHVRLLGRIHANSGLHRRSRCPARLERNDQVWMTGPRLLYANATHCQEWVKQCTSNDWLSRTRDDRVSFCRASRCEGTKKAAWSMESGSQWPKHD